MGSGRARAGVACCLGALALLAAGCGATTRPNDPRPQVSTRVSVTIGPHGVVVQPGQVAFGPEKNQQIPQNREHPQPPIKGDKSPLSVVFVVANQTEEPTQLVLRGTKDTESPMIPAHSPGTFQTELPTGSYAVGSTVKDGETGRLAVGAYRASSKNDLLLP